MQLQLWPVEDTDITAMAAIRAQEWETETFWISRIGWYLRGEHSPQQALAARAAFAAVEGGRLVGFVAGHRTLRYECDGELQWVNIDRSKRGHGIAAALIAKIGSWFVEQGAIRICVNVDPNSLSARNLYMKCGAQSLNEQWMVWEDSRLMGSEGERRS